MGEFLEELSQDIERMKAEGKSTEAIVSYTDKAVARWNAATLMTMRIRDMVAEAVR